MLSPFERELLSKAVELRAIARRDPALEPHYLPFINKTLEDTAAHYVTLQKREAEQAKAMETLVRCVEDFMLATASLNISAGNVIKRYREENPRKE